jgi:hypothetical protein
VHGLQEVAGHLKDAGKTAGYGKVNPPQLVVTLVSLDGRPSGFIF